MRGRRLATTEELIAVVSPTDGSLAVVDRLREWTAENGLGLETVAVGESVADVYDREAETLGLTVGGDGTFLEGIQQFEPRNVPVLGVNTGSLAFLVRVDVEDLEAALSEVVGGRATIDNRQQLAVEAGDLSATGINDVVLQHVPPAEPFGRKITTLDVFADDGYVGAYEGTGLAVATPTGSTGISLSANGPIHNPTNNASLQIVPLHTHRIGVRPLIVSEETVIRIVTDDGVDLLVDGGRHHVRLEGGELVTITGADRTANVVRTSYDDDFFTAIAEHLGWGARGAENKPLPAGATVEQGPRELPERALQVATEAAESVGGPLRDLHGRVESEEYKTDRSDVITEADRLSENIIATAIGNEYPDHAIRTEEGIYSEGRIDVESPYTWVIDPLDGTGNYANGNPNYAVSIALLEDGEPIVGVVYAPETNERWSAIAGDGAWKNGVPIGTTDRDRLDESMLMSGYDPDGSFLAHFYEHTRGVRRLGSAALHLCYLASGSADAVWEYDTYPWDVAAGILVAREAGATLTDSGGEPFDPYADRERRELVGSNGHIHPEIMRRLRRNERLYNADD